MFAVLLGAAKQENGEFAAEKGWLASGRVCELQSWLTVSAEGTLCDWEEEKQSLIYSGQRLSDQNKSAGDDILQTHTLAFNVLLRNSGTNKGTTEEPLKSHHTEMFMFVDFLCEEGLKKKKITKSEHKVDWHPTRVSRAKRERERDGRKLVKKNNHKTNTH